MKKIRAMYMYIFPFYYGRVKKIRSIGNFFKSIVVL